MMKKLLLALLSVFCIISTYAQEAISYEIDEEATANVPFKIGDRILEDEDCGGKQCYLIFLGVTKTGQFLVQSFYLSGCKYTDPVLIYDIDSSMPIGNSNKLSEGKLIFWYENGQKKSETRYIDGKLEGGFTEWYENGRKAKELYYRNGEMDGPVTTWYENGQKELECSMKEDNPVGICRVWDEQGNLIEVEDYGKPHS